MTPESRLRAFAFPMTRDGVRREFVFWAPDRAAARRYAVTWAAAQGWALGDEEEGA